MFEVSKEFSFEASHALPHLPPGHKCRNIHGHSYRIKVVCRGKLDERGFVVDYAEISEAMRPILSQMDHAYLAGNNESIPDGRVCKIDAPCTSAEYLAKWIYDTLRESLPELHQVFVYETAKTSVAYPC